MGFCYNPGQKSLWQYCNIHIFLSFPGFLLTQRILFEIFLQFSLPPPYTKLKLGKNSGYTRPTLFVGWGEGSDLCELENAPETQKCPKTFVFHWRFQSFYLALFVPFSWYFYFTNWTYPFFWGFIHIFRLPASRHPPPVNHHPWKSLKLPPGQFSLVSVLYALRCFDTVFQRPYRYFSIALKVILSLSDRYEIFTSDWL